MNLPANVTPSRIGVGIGTFAVLVPLCAACRRRETEHEPAEPVDVVLIVVDTLRADAVQGATGEPVTPGLRELAEDGVVFRRCFSHAPITLASHAALFSSRPPYRTGVLNNGDEVPAELPLLAELMRDHGYATASAVSLGSLRGRDEKGLTRGFDLALAASYRVPVWAEDTAPLVSEALDHLAAHRPAFLFAHFADPHSPFRAHGLVERWAEVFLDGEPVGRPCTSEAEVWTGDFELAPGQHTIEVRSDDPFKIQHFWCSYGRVTSDFSAKEHWNETSSTFSFESATREGLASTLNLWIEDASPERAEELTRYQREVDHVDRFVQALLHDLKSAGLYDSSLIVFTSDHGEGLYDHGRRGHAWDVFDESIHVPLIVKLPAGHPARAALRENEGRLVRLIDVVPTILDAAGLPPLPGQEGVSLLQQAERVHVAEAHVPNAPHETICMRDDRFKLIYDADDDSFAMYDVVADPAESVDVFAARGAERSDWQPRLRAIATMALRTEPGEALDPETKADLEALGYLGD